MKYLLIIFVGVIMVFSLGLRLSFLDSLPLSLSNDEISLGYDAYSLLKTGRDEHGVLFPLALASLGNAKAPAYAYLQAPFIYIFSNTDFTARITSAIAGILTIICLGLIAKFLTKSNLVGLLTVIISSLTPWHLVFSRMAIEANLALMFLSLGLALNFRRYLFLSGLFLGLSLYAYHSEWLLVPLLLLFLPYKSRKLYLTFFVTVLPIPLAYSLLPDSVSRQSGTETLLHAYGFSLTALKVFIRNYFQYLNPGYLFFHGLEMFTTSHPYESGLFSWPLLLPFFIGLSKFRKYKFLIIWTLISPVVSAFTPGTPNFRRDLVSFLPYTLWISIGLSLLFTRHKYLFILTAGLTFYTCIIFAAVFFHHVAPSRADTYPPFRQITDYLQIHRSEYQTAIVDFRYGVSGQFTGVPHLYLKYYSRDSINFSVRRIDWSDPNFVISPDNYYIVPVSNRPPASSRMQLNHQFFDVNNHPTAEIWSLF